MELQKLLNKAMEIFTDFFWFTFTSSVIWSISFIATHFLSLKKGSNSQSAIGLRRKEMADSIRKYDESDHEEKEAPTLCFKFQYQFFEHQLKQLDAEGEDKPSPSSNAIIHNYDFLSGKDFTGFIEEPAAKTCRVFLESYRQPSASFSYSNKFFNTVRRTSSLSSKDFPRQSSKDQLQGQIHGKFVSNEEKSTKVKAYLLDGNRTFGYLVPRGGPSSRRISSVSPKRFQKPSLSAEAVNFRSFEELEKEKSDEIGEAISVLPKLPSFNSEVESNSDGNSVKANSFVASKGSRNPSLYARNRGSVHTAEDERLLKTKGNLSSEFKIIYQGRFMFNDFAGFVSDTESFSASDGYSVKDLIVDSDSNGLFSDSDSEDCGYKGNRARYKGTFLEAVRRLEKLQLQFTHSSDTESIAANDEFSNPIITKEKEPGQTFDHDEKVMNQGPDESGAVQKCEESILLYMNGKHDDERQVIEANKNTHKGYDDTSSTSDLVSEFRFDLSPHRLLETISSTDEELDKLYKAFEKEKDVSAISSADEELDKLYKELEKENKVSTISNTAEELDKLDKEHETEKKVSTISSTGEELDKLEKELEREKEVSTISITDEQLDKLDKELEREKEISEERPREKGTKLVDDLDEAEYDELDSLWEHEDLIEQLKMELKKVRDADLPTISEESVAPKIVEDLKPWKTDKILHEDPIEELHKFHQTYRERMWKLDILSYQKMNTIVFLNLKDPARSKGLQQTVIPAIKSLRLQNVWPCNLQMDVYPVDSLIKEVKNDLELVYVGQTCLSWEFLRWQYEKARELPEFDHQYNHVADEFQQFQAILQRFIEDELFQGPRLLYYVKNRSFVKNLLQVPEIKEDTPKEKMGDESKGNFIITIETLEDIMEESIRIFWQFVKADKDDAPGFLKMLIGSHAELQDPADSQLMTEIHFRLEKKERRLKDILRTGNCLVKKFKKPKDDRMNLDLFFSQVDLKLVARVLRMQKITTQQLVWCHEKLSNIRFVEAKVYREPSFFLFPC